MTKVSSRGARLAADCIAAIAAVGIVSLMSRAAGLNAPTVALVLHTTVVILAAMRHLGAGVAAALAATVSFSFFLHPEDTWRITDPANWLALVSFLVVSSVVGRLLFLARDQAAAAEEQRQQVTTLYRLGVDLLAASEGTDAAGSALTLAVRALPGSGAGIVRQSPDSTTLVTWVGTEAGPEMIEEASRCLADGTSRSLSAGARRCTATPIDADEAVVFVAPESSATAVDSVAALVALTLRHQRAVHRAARVDAARESEHLRTSLIRAISHDLNTPLTAIMLDLDVLERELHDPETARPRLTSLKEDAASLRQRIESLLAMARIDAGAYRPRLEPAAPAELFGAAARHLALVAEGRQLVVRVQDGCPDALADITLTTEILANLLDNAHRAAPHGDPIHMTARVGAPGRIVLEVADSGPGLDLDDARWAHGEPVPVDELQRRGLGLEIARTFARACGGTVTIRRDGDTIASLDLPVADEEPRDDA